MRKVSLRQLLTGNSAVEAKQFMFHYPHIASQEVIPFPNLPERLQKQIVPTMAEPYLSQELARKQKEHFLVLTLHDQGYVGHAKRTFQKGRRVLTAKEIMEQRVKYGSNPKVLGFLHELQDRRYNCSKPVFQKDYETLCKDPELRWFAALATSTALVAEGERFMILPKSQTLEDIAAGKLIVTKDTIERNEYSSRDQEGYLFPVPQKEQFENFDNFPLYLALADNDDKLVQEYQRTMGRIKFGSAGAQRTWDTEFERTHTGGLQARLANVGFLHSAYGKGREFPWVYFKFPQGLVPTKLKGFHGVLEFPGDYPCGAMLDDNKVYRALPEPQIDLRERRTGISAMGGCDPQDMRWDFQEAPSFHWPCTVVSVKN